MATRILLFIVTNLAVLFVATLVLSLLGLPTHLHDEHGINFTALLVFAAILGFGGSFVSLALSKSLAKMFMRVKVIDRPSNETEQWLTHAVGQLARQAGIQTPEVGIYESPDMNAFGTGARRNHALVAVSSGLLQSMRREEVEAVLAHEVSHCANGDMITLTLLQGVLNTFVIFLSRIIGFVVDKVVFRNERGIGIGYWLSVIAAQILLGILASIVVAAFSRYREFKADHGAARLVGPRPMIGALEALGRARGQVAMPESLRSFGIRGGRGRGISALWMTHPPLEARIDRLRQLGS